MNWLMMQCATPPIVVGLVIAIFYAVKELAMVCRRQYPKPQPCLYDVAAQAVFRGLLWNMVVMVGIPILVPLETNLDCFNSLAVGYVWGVLAAPVSGMILVACLSPLLGKKPRWREDVGW